MRAKFIYEKFVEDSDPIEDLGIGTRKKISKWLKKNSEKDDDDNALAECAAHGKTEWVKFLIARGVDVHVISNYALRHAAENGHKETVRVLLDAGADVHANNNWALRYAADHGHTEIVKMLLDAGANVHANENEALHWAIRYGHTETVKVLQDHIAKAKKVKESLNEKFSKDSDPVEDLGIGPRKQIDKFINSMGEEAPNDDIRLVFCARFGKTAWVKFLLDQGVHIASWDNAALRWSAEFGHFETVKLLIDSGAQIDAWEHYSLRIAIKESKYKIADYILNSFPVSYWKNFMKHGIIHWHMGYNKSSDYIKSYIKNKNQIVSEKFVEDSDPVKDLGIGSLRKVYDNISNGDVFRIKIDDLKEPFGEKYCKDNLIKVLEVKRYNNHENILIYKYSVLDKNYNPIGSIFNYYWEWPFDFFEKYLEPARKK